MKTAVEIHSDLNHIEFRDIEQYLFELLTAFQIPDSTISRLISNGRLSQFAEPVFVFKRAAILYSDTLPDAMSLTKVEEKITQQYRLILIIHEEMLFCKDLVTEEIVECKPGEVSDHLSFFMPLIFGRGKDKDISVTTE